MKSQFELQKFSPFLALLTVMKKTITCIYRDDMILSPFIVTAKIYWYWKILSFLELPEKQLLDVAAGR